MGMVLVGRVFVGSVLVGTTFVGVGLGQKVVPGTILIRHGTF